MARDGYECGYCLKVFPNFRELDEHTESAGHAKHEITDWDVPLLRATAAVAGELRRRIAAEGVAISGHPTPTVDPEHLKFLFTLKGDNPPGTYTGYFGIYPRRRIRSKPRPVATSEAGWLGEASSPPPSSSLSPSPPMSSGGSHHDGPRVLRAADKKKTRLSRERDEQ